MYAINPQRLEVEDLKAYGLQLSLVHGMGRVIGDLRMLGYGDTLGTETLFKVSNSVGRNSKASSLPAMHGHPSGSAYVICDPKAGRSVNRG
ncbi:hypothetical protein CABS01_10339 [Colletotrichum abscissum]|uniref:uncharacterized protein n=1 Tax=Colletotrichum abscissum TaxID=1671311 RepID=UPI0027D4D5B7|nr:uncharacterized protein CABS01_10339 [Colletotrichum abscissum]KAK1499941.1 hypothetical protein CABS01_10339 [Colletotrichum abscissum]